jgi:hypothetical protein
MRGEPLLAPIFGRGRVLGAWPASEMGDEQIEEATLFLLGACSCQVKSQNPGWDLLLAVEWDRELQAIGSGARTTGLQSRAQSSAVMPVAVTIRGNDEAPNIPTTSARTKKIVQIGAGGLLLIGGALAWFRIRKHA